MSRLLPKWMVWSLLSLMAFGAWAVLPHARLMGTTLTPGQQHALSSIGLAPLIALLALRPRPPSPGRRARGAALAVLAGVVGGLGNVAYYDALARGGKAASVIALTSLYPLVTVVLAVLLLKERLGPVQGSGLALSLPSLYLLNVQTESDLASAETLLTLLPILLWGLAGFLQKLTTNDLSGELSTLWFLAAYLPLGLALLAREPLAVAVGSRQWTLVACLGFALGLGNYALLAAFAAGGKAAVITPLTGLYPLVSIPVTIVWLGEKPSWRGGVGIALALASVLMLAREPRPKESEEA